MYDLKSFIVKDQSGQVSKYLCPIFLVLISCLIQNLKWLHTIPYHRIEILISIFFSGVKSKTFFAGSVGYISSKASLVKTINDRFLEELPDSDVSNFIRQKRGLPLRVQPLNPESKISKNDENVSASSTAQQDDFSYFESSESAEKSVEKRPSMTYDFLRFQNRMKYNHTKTSMPDVSAQNDTKSEPEDYTSPRDGNNDG